MNPTLVPNAYVQTGERFILFEDAGCFYLNMTTRGGLKMKTFHYLDVEAKKFGDGASKVEGRWLITKEMGAENFPMRLFEMMPEGYSPFHRHPSEHEIFILEGEGLVIGGDRATNIRRRLCYLHPPQTRCINSKTLVRRQ